MNAATPAGQAGYKTTIDGRVNEHITAVHNRIARSAQPRSSPTATYARLIDAKLDALSDRRLADIFVHLSRIWIAFNFASNGLSPVSSAFTASRSARSMGDVIF